ncbi:hypothetical protein OIE66_24585 [Nonomuraea sp. NBC_01738]|uniref:hypothetical protein n=1 Tax=Nonomuraea sp. NBC_01738 TaxID=2976003 RepID=UPI002E166079|nr:hypothetical protein OIE66_24585 [Nonomuraea sp. NBC_01738]
MHRALFAHLAAAIALVACAAGPAVVTSSAHAQPQARHQTVQQYTAMTYNMQSKPYTDLDKFMQDHDIIAIQEAQLNNDRPDGTIACRHTSTGRMVNRPYYNRQTNGRDRQPYRLYYFAQGNSNAKNLAFATKHVPAKCVILSRHTIDGGTTWTAKRDVIGLSFGADNTWFWNIHANSSNLATLIANITLNLIRNGNVTPWTLLGDFNIDLITHPNPGLGLQNNETRYDSGGPTHIQGGNLDWMVAENPIPGYQVRTCQSPAGSDHYPVEFTVNGRTDTCKSISG